MTSGPQIEVNELRRQVAELKSVITALSEARSNNRLEVDVKAMRDDVAAINARMQRPPQFKAYKDANGQPRAVGLDDINKSTLDMIK